jgi:hypothetical protein
VPAKDGLAAAGEELDREAEGRGGMPKKAGCSGASHAMTVNEPVLTLLCPKSHLALLPGEPPEALAAVRARLDAQAGWAPRRTSRSADHRSSYVQVRCFRERFPRNGLRQQTRPHGCGDG